MSASKNLRVLHLPFNIGGNPYGLSRAERKLGLISDCVIFKDAFTKFPADRILFGSGDSQLVKELKRWQFFLNSLFRYDVFHFNFGQKFFPIYVRPWKRGESLRQAITRFAYFVYALLIGHLDLWILKLLGKKMYVLFQGDDIRQGDFAKSNYRVHFAPFVDKYYYDSYSDARKRKLVKLYDRYCDGLYAINPDLMNILPRRTQFLRYCHLDLNDWKPTGQKNSRPLIVHAPTHREVKGTSFLLTAIENLRRRGYDFDFVLVEKMPHLEARNMYERADLLVDQLLAGWYGALAMELMALGKPVVSYIRKEDLKHAPSGLVADLPVISADPSNIEVVLEHLLDSQDSWVKIGQRSRAFVEKWHEPMEIAQAVVAGYES